MTETPLLASIGPIHADVLDRRAALETVFPLFDQDFHAAGLDLQITGDLEHFNGLVRSVGKFVPNAFDPKIKPFRSGDAIGFVVRDAAGIVATYAVRLYRFGVTTLADHLTTLSLFYANPVEQMARGERLLIEGEADRYASTIDDTVVWVGAMWVRPDYRGRVSNLPTVLGVLGGSVIQARWGRQTTISIVERGIVDHGVVKQRYRSQYVLDRIRWFRPHIPDRTEMFLIAKEPPVTFAQIDELIGGDTRLRVNEIDGSAVKARA